MGKVVSFRRLASKKHLRWWHVALAFAVLCVVITSGLSPAFPDADLIRYGLFVPFYDIDEAVIEHCETHGGRAERVFTRINCYGENSTLWWAMEVGRE